VIAATITIAIALPHLISWAATRTAALKPLPLAVDFPIGFHVEILQDRDERHLVGIDCVTDGKEKRTFFDFVFHKIGPPSNNRRGCEGTETRC